MNLNEACKDILKQLEAVLNNIKEEDFKKPIPTLNNSTIGQHIRHTLEFFTCLMHNCENGVVNYDKRDHDRLIETDKDLALTVIDDINSFLDKAEADTELVLEVNYSFSDDILTKIKTSLSRELAYNIEHAIHHMAIIKIGLKEIASYISVPGHFGVAVSTIKYQQQAPSV